MCDKKCNLKHCRLEIKKRGHSVRASLLLFLFYLFFIFLTYTLFCYIISHFTFTLGIAIHCVRSAVFVLNVCNDEIRFFYHPPVSVGDGVFRGNVFKLRINGKVKSVFLIFKAVFPINDDT